MKKLLFLFLLSPFFISCGEDKPEVDPVKDSLSEETQRLTGITEQQAEALDSFFRAMNDIQSNLDEIRKKENMIARDTAGGDVGSRKDQIVNDIKSIYDLMVQNKQRLASAKKNLKDANLKIASMQQTIDNLNSQLVAREQEITELKDDLEKKNLELSNLTMNYQELQQESDAKTEQLNTAYYAFGTSKELEKQGIINKEGGLLGIGKSQKVSENFDSEYFTRVDITRVNEIPLGAKEAKLLTTHPAGSYKIEGADGKAEKIVITDSGKFWSVSKYLVIVVK
jgi:hypothetical protein